MLILFGLMYVCMCVCALVTCACITRRDVILTVVCGYQYISAYVCLCVQDYGCMCMYDCVGVSPDVLILVVNVSVSCNSLYIYIILDIPPTVHYISDTECHFIEMTGFPLMTPLKCIPSKPSGHPSLSTVLPLLFISQ